MSRVVVSESGPPVIYASGSVLARSFDAGASWAPVSGTWVTGLTVDAASPGVLVAAHQGYGPSKSVNYGRTWLNVGDYWLWGSNVSSLAIDLLDRQAIYLGTTGLGLYRLNTQWQSAVKLNTGYLEEAVAQIVVAPSNPAVVYAGLEFGFRQSPGGVLRSTDRGNTWVMCGEPVRARTVDSIAVDPTDSDVVFAAAGSVYRSRDGCTNWTQLSLSRENVYPSSLAIDPHTPSLVYAATFNGGVFRTEDAGESWWPINAGLEVLDVRTVALDPRDSNVVYAGTRVHGVYRSADRGETWVPANNGLALLGVRALYLSEGPDRTMLAGTFGGVFRAIRGSEDWVRLGDASVPGAASAICGIPGDPRVLLAYADSKLFRSGDGGRTWQVVAADPPLAFVRSLVVDRRSPGTVFAVSGVELVRTTDGGLSWQRLPGSPVVSLAWVDHPSGSGSLYATSGSQVFTSTDRGETWTKVGSEVGSGWGIQVLAVAPSQPLVMYVSKGWDSYFRTTDGGRTWVSMETSPSRSGDSIRGLVVSHEDPNLVYSVFQSGLFVTVNGGREWGAINAGLQGWVTGPLVIDPADDRVLYVGTSQGVARLDLREQQAVQWVPVAARTGGVGGSQWRTDVAVLNADGLPAEVTLRLHQGGKGVELKRFLLPPRQQVLVQDVVGEAGVRGAGPLEIISNYPVRALSRTYAAIGEGASCFAGGTFGQEYTAVTPAEGLSAGDEVVLPMLVESNRYRTNLLFTNTGEEPAALQVELLDGAGTSLATFPVTLSPRSYRQETQPFLRRVGKGNLDRGWARVRVLEGAGIVLSASMVDNRTNDPTTIAPVTPRALLGNATHVQVAARASGLHGSTWRTDLGLLNPGPTTGDVSVRYHGVTPPAFASLSAPSRVQWLIEDVLEALDVSGSGALSVAPTVPIVVTTRTYNQIPASAACAPGGTFGQGYPGMGEDEFTSGSHPVFLAGLQESSRFRSNIALTAGTWPGRATIALYDGASGTLVGSFEVYLSSGGYLQEVQPFARRFGRRDIDSGYAVVTVSAGAALVSGSLIDNITNDPITVPALP